MTRLKRTIGLPVLLFYGLGNILGAGIYVLIGKVAGEAGMYVPLAFFTASVVAGISAFTYSELSARYPLSAGEAVYIDEGFHSAALSRLTGVLIACSGMVSAATISRGFYGYFSTILPLPEVLVITGIIVLLGALTMWGISQSVGVAASLTVIEIVGLLLVIWAGRDALATLPARIDTLVPPMQSSAMIGIILGSFLAFFAYIGFEDMVNIAEEVKNPQRNLPAAILLALLIASLMYASVALVAVLSVDQETLSASQAPLAEVLSATSDIDPRIISIISMIAIVNGALIQLIMASRLFYGMASKGWLWHQLATVNAKTQTPINATVLVVVLTLGLALWIPLETLARSTSYLVLVVFALANAALLLIKRTQATPEGIINNPLWVPVTGFISCLGLVCFQLVSG
ncbi:MAG: amino acid permease [Gammaproteobacteria bacterium]|nr:amino acid permease [Gammaproteobacteria bacterium]NNJ96891.1 amino acid permease [Gammaproteobacteria bacterium]